MEMRPTTMGKIEMSRYALVHVAAKRSRQLHAGAWPLVQCSSNHCATALREVRDGLLTHSMPVQQARDIESAAGCASFVWLGRKKTFTDPTSVEGDQSWMPVAVATSFEEATYTP